MIFVTVGSQMPFDRLIRALDAWLAQRADPPEVLAQVGESDYVASHMKTVKALSPAEFRASVARAELMVAHAGMGSVLTALELGVPLLVMPRRGALRETRNDHQVATAKWLQSRPGVFVAEDEQDLPGVIERVLALRNEPLSISASASPALIEAIQIFINGPEK